MLSIHYSFQNNMCRDFSIANICIYIIIYIIKWLYIYNDYIYIYNDYMINDYIIEYYNIES